MFLLNTLFFLFCQLYAILTTSIRNRELIFNPYTVSPSTSIETQPKCIYKKPKTTGKFRQLDMIERDLFCLFDRSLANNCPTASVEKSVCIVTQTQTKQIQQWKYNYFFQLCMPVFFYLYIWIEQTAIYLLCFDSMNMLPIKRQLTVCSVKPHI